MVSFHYARVSSRGKKTGKVLVFTKLKANANTSLLRRNMGITNFLHLFTFTNIEFLFVPVHFSLEVKPRRYFCDLTILQTSCQFFPLFTIFAEETESLFNQVLVSR